MGEKGYGGYMAHKVAKLQEQFQTEVVSSIFEGVRLWVDGFTTPPQNELRRLLIANGGEWIPYPFSPNITHIICENLPDGKVKTMNHHTRKIIVTPQWLTDSVKFQRKMATGDYIPKRLQDEKQKNLSKLLDSAGRKRTEGEEKERDQSGIESVEKGVETAETFTKVPPSKPNNSNNNNNNTVVIPAATGVSYSANDPDFVPHFFQQSRLHFIGGWKQRYEKMVQDGLFSSVDDNSACPEFKFPSFQRDGEVKKKNGESMASKLFTSKPTNETSKNNNNNNNNNNNRRVMHIDFDCFFASVAVRNNPELASKPIVISHSEGPGGKSGEVSCANYEARKFGIRNGMFISSAKSLCSSLVVLPYDFEGYENVSSLFYFFLHSISPNVQALSVDEAFVDISHWSLRNEEERKTDGEDEGERERECVRKCREIIFERTGCTCSAGVGPNLLIARLATRKAKPNGQFFVDNNEQEVLRFLEDVDLSDLPGIGRKTSKVFNSKGLVKVRDAWSLSLTTLKEWFGTKKAEKIYEGVRGRDERTIEGDVKKRKSIGAQVSWGVRLSTPQELSEFVSKLAKEVVDRLTKADVEGKMLTLKLWKKQAGAGEASKFLGHGMCDFFTKSAPLPPPILWASVVNRGVETATSESSNDIASLVQQNISTVVMTMLRELSVTPDDVRGMGIAISKLFSKKARDSVMARKETDGASCSVFTRTDVASTSSSSRKPSSISSSVVQNRRENFFPSSTGAAAAAAAASSSSCGNRDYLPRLSQIDPAVVSELPSEMLSELAAEYLRGGGSIARAPDVLKREIEKLMAVGKRKEREREDEKTKKNKKSKTGHEVRKKTAYSSSVDDENSRDSFSNFHQPTVMKAADEQVEQVAKKKRQKMFLPDGSEVDFETLTQLPPEIKKDIKRSLRFGPSIAEERRMLNQNNNDNNNRRVNDADEEDDERMMMFVGLDVQQQTELRQQQQQQVMARKSRQEEEEEEEDEDELWEHFSKARPAFSEWIRSEQTPSETDLNLILSIGRKLVKMQRLEEVTLMLRCLNRTAASTENESWMEIGRQVEITLNEEIHQQFGSGRFC